MRWNHVEFYSLIGKEALHLVIIITNSLEHNSESGVLVILVVFFIYLLQITINIGNKVKQEYNKG